MSLTRRARLSAIAAAACLWPAQRLGASQPASGDAAGLCRDCNVVVVAIDTLRRDHLGCYGYRKGTSPNIDAVAKDGAVFDDFVVQANLTPLSIASIFTSQFPPENGYTSFSSTISAASITLPEVLRAFGYKTAAFLTSPEFCVQETDFGGEKIDPLASFTRGFDSYKCPSTTAAAFHRDVPGEEVFDWLKRNKDSKLFVWLPIGEVHWPYGQRAPARIKERFYPPASTPPRLEKLGMGWWGAMGHIYDGAFYPFPGSKSPPQPFPLSDDDRRFILARYDAGIYYADAFVGQLLETLAALDLRRKTIVVILGEHGEDLGEHGYYTHYDIYNTEILAPLILVSPRAPARPARIASLVTGLDIAPTLLDLLGIPVFHQARGTSFRAILEHPQRQAGGDGVAYSMRIPMWEIVLYQGMLKRASAPELETLRPYVEDLSRATGEWWSPTLADTSAQTSRWKLIHRRSRKLLERISWWSYLTGKPVKLPEYELYDLRADPFESKDVFDSRRSDAAALLQALTAFERRMDARAEDQPLRPRQNAIIPYP